MYECVPTYRTSLLMINSQVNLITADNVDVEEREQEQQRGLELEVPDLNLDIHL